MDSETYRASVVGAISGIMVAPVVFLDPNMMQSIVVYAFAAAVLGGIESPVGAVVGGLVVGCVLSYVSGYVSSDVVTFGAFVVLIAVLMIRPAGLFSRTTERRV